MQHNKLQIQNVSKDLARLLPTDGASRDNLKTLLGHWQERYSRTSPAAHTRS